MQNLEKKYEKSFVLSTASRTQLGYWFNFVYLNLKREVKILLALTKYSPNSVKRCFFWHLMLNIVFSTVLNQGSKILITCRETKHVGVIPLCSAEITGNQSWRKALVSKLTKTYTADLFFDSRNSKSIGVSRRRVVKSSTNVMNCEHCPRLNIQSVSLAGIKQQTQYFNHIDHCARLRKSNCFEKYRR